MSGAPIMMKLAAAVMMMINKRKAKYSTPDFS
jgi:hypothetical protein